MDREKLFSHLEQYYYPKKDILNRLPLGVPLEGFWQELLNRRMGRRTMLPLHATTGETYWYVVTEKMVAASERIIEELMANEVPYDPYRTHVSVASLEEVYYTTYVEGAVISMQDAMTFLQGDEEPHDINEQMILNNRQACSYIAGNLYNPVDEQFICTLAYILTERMDNGGDTYRTDDTHEIPFMGREPYTVPPASMIPDKMHELIRFLQDVSVHPLIKAGVAQAWILLVRPFDEGNERLARLLSTVILLRAGYSFFGEVSLSSIIARQSYEYYNATANILRRENGDDLTYFLEYFLNLLVKALDERKVRLAQRLAREQEAERMMATQPLATEDERVGVDMPQRAAAVRQESFIPPVAAQAPDGGDIDEDDDMDENMGISEERNQPSPQPMSLKGGDADGIRERLKEAGFKGNLLPPVVEILEEFLDEDIGYFTRDQLMEGLGYTPKQAETVIARLKEIGVITASHRAGKKMVYSFPHVRNKPRSHNGYSRELIGKLQELSRSEVSLKDKRIGGLLLEKLSEGIVSHDDYIQRGWESKWASDMRLAEQIGLVAKVSPAEYAICESPEADYQLLLPAQKAFAAAVYKEFGGEVFSLEMVVATLDYSSSHASAVLHQFTLLQILACRKEDVNRYQFLVTPEQHPECFAA